MLRLPCLAPVLGFAAGLLIGCVTERGVERALDDANYCDAASECVVLYPGCPLGCHALVNESEAEAMQKKIDRYHKTHRDECIYDCAGLGEIRCEEGRCVADEDL